MEIFNIGVYNKNEADFFNLLTENKIDVFIDVRQRRGVRGSKYAFVNSNKLQEKLALLNINYIHLLELAPNDEIRNQQKAADRQNRELKTKRENLDENFISKYSNLILNNFNFISFIENLKLKNYKRIVFFCVEDKAKACHRSIITEKLRTEFKFDSKNL